MNDFAIRQLAAAVTLQAVKDFCNGSDKKKVKILKDLHSRWMQDFTNGHSLIVAEQLELHPDEIRARVCKYESEELNNAVS